MYRVYNHILNICIFFFWDFRILELLEEGPIYSKVVTDINNFMEHIFIKIEYIFILICALTPIRMSR